MTGQTILSMAAPTSFFAAIRHGNSEATANSGNGYAVSSAAHTMRICQLSPLHLLDIESRPQVGELGEQIVVRPNLVLRYLPVCEDSQECVVGKCPATVREGRWALGIIEEHLRQHCLCHSPLLCEPISRIVPHRCQTTSSLC
jgi:hypothetical protein